MGNVPVTGGESNHISNKSVFHIPKRQILGTFFVLSQSIIIAMFIIVRLCLYLTLQNDFAEFIYKFFSFFVVNSFLKMFIDFVYHHHKMLSNR